MHRILLAEDDDAIVRLLTDFLREEGFAVTAAAGERSAREALERERFDLALVDLQLADGSGFGVRRRPGPAPAGDLSDGLQRREHRSIRL